MNIDKKMDGGLGLSILNQKTSKHSKTDKNLSNDTGHILKHHWLNAGKSELSKKKNSYS